MKYRVNGRADIEADSPGAAEEIATREHVDWQVIPRGWAYKATARALAVFSFGWIVTGPIWDDGVAAVFGGHATRALAPVGALLALLG